MTSALAGTPNPHSNICNGVDAITRFIVPSPTSEEITAVRRLAARRWSERDRNAQRGGADGSAANDSNMTVRIGSNGNKVHVARNAKHYAKGEVHACAHACVVD